MRHRALLAGSLACALSVGISHPAETDPAAERLHRIENGLRRLVRLESRPAETFSIAESMRRHGVSGMSVALIENGRVAWSRAYGVTEAGGSTPVTPGTRFRACSLSKLAAAVAALSMVQDGDLSLRGDVNERLESWRVPESEWTRVEKVTVERLLSHTAGFNVGGFDPYGLDEPLPDLLQILDGLPPARNEPIRIESVPGTGWSYSGGGYTVLEQLTIDVAGRPFEEIVAERVFAPLGMRHSSYENETPATTDAAVGHDGLGRPIEGRYGATPWLAAAGLRTTAHDYALLLAEILSAHQGQGRVLQAATAREMLTARTGEWGLGPYVQGAGRDLQIGHGGIDHGYNAYAVSYPARGEGVVIFTNGDRGNRVQSELLRSVAVELGWPDFEQIPMRDVVVEPLVLSAYEGEYRVGDSWGFRVEARQGVLVFVEPDGYGARLVAASERVFFDPDDASVIEFVVRADGSVGEVVIRSRSGGEWRATPVPSS